MINGRWRNRFSAIILLVGLMCQFVFVQCGKDSRQRDDGSLSILIGVDYFGRFEQSVAQEFPEIVFDREYYLGTNTSSYFRERFRHHDLPDIVFSPMHPDENLQKENLLDLGGYNFVQNFKTAYLNEYSVDGAVYLLPGPSSANGIVYNKTLFEEMGWEMPTSHREFIELCQTVRDTTDLIPVSVACKYSGSYFAILGQLAQCEYLHSPQGKKWAEQFAVGKASAEEGFGSAVRLLQEWIDAGAFGVIDNPADRNQKNPMKTYNELAERKCAMAIIGGNHSVLAEIAENASDELASFPFYGYGEDSEFVATVGGLRFGINKRLGEPGNEKKLKNALKLMEYLSTPEGQMNFYTGRGDMLPLRGNAFASAPVFSGLDQALERGHAANYLYTGYEDVIVEVGEQIREVCLAGGGSLDNLTARMDEIRRLSLENPDELAIGHIAEDMTEKQTERMVLDFFASLGLGDVVIISKGGLKNGVLNHTGICGKMYAGPVTSENYMIPLPKNYRDNIVTATLTARQIAELIESGRIYEKSPTEKAPFEYLYAGMEVERDADGKVLAITRDGRVMEDDECCVVVMTARDYTRDFEETVRPQDTGICIDTAFREYLAQNDPIVPEADSAE